MRKFYHDRSNTERRAIIEDNSYRQIWEFIANETILFSFDPCRQSQYQYIFLDPKDISSDAFPISFFLCFDVSDVFSKANLFVLHK
jgi:hypothetical protein